MKEFALGTKGEAETQVDESRLACTVGSGSLPVYATPMMVALMEQAACVAFRDALEEGETSVGTALNILHTAATPPGMEAHAVAEVTEVSGREITFHVVAYDHCGKIGEGMHKRVVVRAERFLEKTNGKMAK